MPGDGTPLHVIEVVEWPRVAALSTIVYVDPSSVLPELRVRQSATICGIWRLPLRAPRHGL